MNIYLRLHDCGRTFLTISKVLPLSALFVIGQRSLTQNLHIQKVSLVKTLILTMYQVKVFYLWLQIEQNTCKYIVLHQYLSKTLLF